MDTQHTGGLMPFSGGIPLKRAGGMLQKREEVLGAGLLTKTGVILADLDRDNERVENGIGSSWHFWGGTALMAEMGMKCVCHAIHAIMGK